MEEMQRVTYEGWGSDVELPSSPFMSPQHITEFANTLLTSLFLSSELHTQESLTKSLAIGISKSSPLLGYWRVGMKMIAF